jgi:hypothetical protein
LIKPEDFYRATERYITLGDLVNLTYEDIEAFYDTEDDSTRLGTGGGQTE